MSASGAGGTTTGIGPVDALIDVARGPCVDSVAVRGNVAEALLGLASAVGEPMPEAGHWLGVERQLEALARIEAGLVRILEEVRGKVHERIVRGLKRLCWRAQVARRAVRDMVRGTLVQDEWVDGARLDRVYGGIVGAWRRVSFWLGKCDAVEAVLRGLTEWVPRHVRGVCAENRVRDAGGLKVAKRVRAVRNLLSATAARLSESGEYGLADAAGDVAGMAEALGKLGSLGVPEVEVVEGDGLGRVVNVDVSGCGRAFLRGDGGGIVVEWRSEFKVPVWLGEEGEGDWAAKCAKEVGDAVSGLVLGQRLNAWAESEGCALPVQALRGVAVRVEQGWGNDSDPLGAWTCLVLQVTVGVGVPVADIVGNEAWEDLEGKLRAGVARECLDVLSTCEESGAGYAGGGVLGALVVEGGCGIGGGAGGVAGDVMRGVASVRLCALRVGQVVGQVGCGEWSDALGDVLGLEREGSAGGDVITSFGKESVWGSGIDVNGCDELACAAHSLGSECDGGLGWTRGELGDGAMGRAWDDLAAGDGKAQGLWDGMRGWRVEVRVAGDVVKAGRSSGLEGVERKLGSLVEQGCEESGYLGLWRSLLGGGDLVGKVVEYMKVFAGVDGGTWSGKGAVVDIESMRQAGTAGDALDCWELHNMFADGRGVAQNEAEAVQWLRAAAEQGHAECQHKLGDMYASGRGVGQDDAEAVRWFRAATEQGHAEGQYMLGTFLSRGGVLAQGSEAVRLLRAAADQGHAGAKQRLWYG